MPRRDVAVTAVAGVLTAAIFIAAAYHTTMEGLQRIDSAFLRTMISVRSGPFTACAKVLNALGLVYVTLPVRVVIAGFLAWRRRWWHVAAFVVPVVVSEIAIGRLKALYDRPRPPGSLVATSGSSFPSGHAVAATVTVVAAVIALFPEGRLRYWWGAAAVAFSLLMGLSRSYLAAHWLSDAVGGLLLGTSITLLSALVVHAIRERVAPEVEREPT